MNERFNEDGLILSTDYANTMETVVLPYLKAREKVNSALKGDNGKPLYCVSYPADAPKGTVLVLHGFTENAYKFSEIIYSLLQNSFSVVAYDQRGHGRSWRDEGVQSDPSLTHVNVFDEYVNDLKAVCDTVLKTMPKPWMIFSHSMGGAVSSLFLEKYPDVDGVLAANDMVAMSLYKLLKSQGKKVPKDIQIVGFDDIGIISLVTPSFTTVHQPIKAMGQRAIEIVCKHINGESYETENIFQVKLIERETTRKNAKSPSL